MPTKKSTPPPVVPQRDLEDPDSGFITDRDGNSGLAGQAAALAEAERRIQEVRLTGATALTLSGCDLTSLPESVGELTQLEHLYLNGNGLKTLPKSLGKLNRLEHLFLNGNALKGLPESIGELTQLRHLDIGDNQLTILPECIGKLTKLQFFDVSRNQLALLPDSLGRLNQLYYFDARFNRLTLLPDSMRLLTCLSFLYLQGNEQLGLPPEVLGKPRSAATPNSILEYYFRTRRGRRPLNEAKLTLVGRGGVGKTCLIKRLAFNTFNEREPETPGIEIHPWSVDLPDGESVRLHVWDFGGQEILHATHQFFLTERTLYLLVLSGREGNPTQDAEYWLQLIRSFGSDSKVIIALNKYKQHPFDLNRGLLLEKYPFIVNFVSTDCQDGTGVQGLLKIILEQTDKLEHRRANFPSDWFAIKERLAAMQEPFITWDRYQEICGSLGEQNAASQRQLAGFLHILGIALNYHDDPRLSDTHVLNPRWVTEGIYTLLRGGQKANRAGVMSKGDLITMLDTTRYPASCHEFLIRLMEKFQLCFRLPGQLEKYLVPELLGEHQPDIKGLLALLGLGFRYQYEVLPEGLLPRFIVQTQAYSGSNLRWRTGVVLERDGCRAVVRADARERRVDIHITGNEAQRRGLLAIVREKFDEQHRDLTGLSVDERVPVPGEAGVTVSYRHLLMLEEDGEEWFRPEGMRQKVRVADLLNGVDSPETRIHRHSHAQRQVARDDLPGEAVKQQRCPVFICYSHKDARFLEELNTHLKPLVRGGLATWSDQQIRPGARLLDEINAVLESTKVAVMLVSKDFLASDFIHEHELGPLLQRAQSGGVRILWALVGPCAYQAISLEQFQAVHPPDKPLALLRTKAERDSAWVDICRKIKLTLAESASFV